MRGEVAGSVKGRGLRGDGDSERRGGRDVKGEGEGSKVPHMRGWVGRESQGVGREELEANTDTEKCELVQ